MIRVYGIVCLLSEVAIRIINITDHQSTVRNNKVWEK